MQTLKIRKIKQRWISVQMMRETYSKGGLLVWVGNLRWKSTPYYEMWTPNIYKFAKMQRESCFVNAVVDLLKCAFLARVLRCISLGRVWISSANKRFWSFQREQVYQILSKLYLLDNEMSNKRLWPFAIFLLKGKELKCLELYEQIKG